MSQESLTTSYTDKEEKEKDAPLSDEELSRLIQASKDDTFKIKEIKKKDNEDFKKVSLHDIAKKYSELKQPEEKININEEDNQIDQESEKKVSVEEIEDKNLINEEVSNTKDQNLKQINTEENIEEKKVIDEEEHFKVIEEVKKEAFQKGKDQAFSEIKEGSDAAIAKLNNISDKLANTEEMDLSNLEALISNKIVELSSELTGKIIKALPTEFIKKVKSFISTLDNNNGKIEIFISTEDYKVLEKNKEIKGKLKELNIKSKDELSNGELELQINGIRIKHKLEI